MSYLPHFFFSPSLEFTVVSLLHCPVLLYFLSCCIFKISSHVPCSSWPSESTGVLRKASLLCLIAVSLGSFFISLGQRPPYPQRWQLPLAQYRWLLPLPFTAQHLEPYNPCWGLICSWSLGASHPQVRAPVLLSLFFGKLGPKGGAFGLLANLLLEVNKAFEDLCLLRLVLDHTLLGFIIVSVGLRHLTL